MHLCDWQYGASGSFMTQIMNAISNADGHNRARIAIGFPEEVEAYNRFANESGYWPALEKAYLTGHRIDKSIEKEDNEKTAR